MLVIYAACWPLSDNLHVGYVPNPLWGSSVYSVYSDFGLGGRIDSCRKNSFYFPDGLL